MDEEQRSEKTPFVRKVVLDMKKKYKDIWFGEIMDKILIWVIEFQVVLE